MNRSEFYVLAVIGMLLLTLGCSGTPDDRPETVPVSGTVLYKGEPVEGATVSFFVEGAPRAATGVTNEEGIFKLSMFGANDGAIPGDNLITVKKLEATTAADANTEATDDPTAMTNMYAQQMANQDSGPKSLLPEQYGDRYKTPLKETVSKDGPNEFVLQLTD